MQFDLKELKDPGLYLSKDTGFCVFLAASVPIFPCSGSQSPNMKGSGCGADLPVMQTLAILRGFTSSFYDVMF
jgi:hypothetical protein